jgi:D-alanyl-D-alanine carboxypeptidase (penicillin-binding protein 5/6)
MAAMVSRIRIVIAILFMSPLPVAIGQEDVRLAEHLRPLISAHEGTVAVSVKHLTSGATFSHRGDEPMPTASLIKFPVMIAAYQKAADKKIDLTKIVELKEIDKVPGSGILTSHFSAGTRLSIRDLIRLMIVYSDNTATNLVIDQIGLSATSDLMKKWQLPHTQLHSKVFRGESSIAPERSQQFGLGSTTADEMIRLLTQLDNKELVSADASTQMFDHLLACEDKIRFGKFLPADPENGKETKIAIKTGTVGQICTAAGIIEAPSGPIAICVLTSNNRDEKRGDDNAAVLLCAQIARAAYETFNGFSGTASDRPVLELAEGATGELVEALQRSLNRRNGKKGTRISVDGEFGPNTKQAVIAFQRAKKLEPTGVVGEATWKALGPLILKDEDQGSALDLEATNREVLSQRPADLLAGPPLVTADAWAIADSKTGRILWQDKGTDSRDVASTTKIMTAWVILQQAEKDPKLLDEVITFSAEADRTPGSTSGLKTGEKVTVRELIYGLMLPSGNDAAIALADHVGRRMASNSTSTEEQKPVAKFVLQMNRVAKELGMSKTIYANPHGLPDRRNRSSAIDQATLAARVMQDDRFRAFVGTRRHALKVEGPGGYSRNIVWKNGNDLLEIAGYNGVKTGTTDAAGACLVSVGSHQNEELVVVVLGSASNQSRYIDTRNLFRWAWQQRGHKD